MTNVRPPPLQLRRASCENSAEPNRMARDMSRSREHSRNWGSVAIATGICGRSARSYLQIFCTWAPVGCFTCLQKVKFHPVSPTTVNQKFSAKQYASYNFFHAPHSLFSAESSDCYQYFHSEGACPRDKTYLALTCLCGFA